MTFIHHVNMYTGIMVLDDMAQPENYFLFSSNRGSSYHASIGDM